MVMGACVINFRPQKQFLSLNKDFDIWMWQNKIIGVSLSYSKFLCFRFVKHDGTIL
jgi:hypothetical protein